MGLFIHDESHQGQNPESIPHQVIQSYKQATTILLTGTPVLSVAQQTINMLLNVVPRDFGLHTLPEILPSMDNDAMVLSLCKRLFAAWGLRRTRGIIGTSPGRIERIAMIKMAIAQEDHYEQTSTQYNSVTKQRVATCGDFLALLNGIPPEDCANKVYVLDKLLEYYAAQKNENFIVFTSHTTVIDSLYEYYEKFHDYTVAKIHGKLKIDRDAIIDRFQSGEIQLLISNYETIGTGINGFFVLVLTHKANFNCPMLNKNIWVITFRAQSTLPHFLHTQQIPFHPTHE